MSPTNLPAIQLRNQIFYHLDTDLLETANFLAGRLHALEPRNPDSHHLLALTYLRLRRWKAAYDFSHRYGANGRHLGCAYVFAQACLQLGEGGQIARFLEGTVALEKCKGAWLGKSHFNKCSDTQRKSLPDAAACWTLLGRLYRAHGDAKKAGDCYIEAHRSNPFVWDAFEGLCKVGADLRVEKMFLPTAEMVAPGAVTVEREGTEIYADELQQLQQQPQLQEPARPLATQLNFNQQVFTPSADPFNTASKTGSEAGGLFGLPTLKGKNAPLGADVIKAPLLEWDTPTVNSTPGVLDEDVTMGGVMLDSNHEDFVPAAPARRPRPAGQSFEARDRPRQPPVRGQSSETNEESSQAQAQQRKPSVGGHKRTISGQQPTQAPTSTATDTSAPPRRSNRLFGQSSSTKSTSSGRSTVMDSTAASMAGRAPERPSKPATGTKGRIGSTVGRVVSGNRKMLPPDRNEKEKEATKRAPSRTAGVADKTVSATTAPAMPTTTQQQKPVTAPPPQLPPSSTAHATQEALTTLLDNLRDLAIGVYATTRFDTTSAIRTFRSLPAAVRETPWVLSHLGKAYYESGDHRAAEESFARSLKLQPSRTEDMDVYSTVLWHLKKDTALTFLCHNLADVDYTCPERWVAVGNAFSLSREHDQAIAAFRRATQVDPSFAYAWTLMGHEYIANEEFDAALSSFRKAVAIDRRGYGGWYGLGRTYEKLGKLEESERHYRIASSINPSNSTLLVCIGVILERQRNKKAALANYSRALELSPSSALARFKKARVLMHLRFFAEALVELEVLRDLAPDEANVWFLLGKCYKGLGERGEALRALTTSLNLDVKAMPFIKEAMEALDEDDGDESEDD